MKAGHFSGRYDSLILANKVKSKDDSDLMIRDLELLVDSTTTLVSAQNGMDNEVPIRHAFPHNTILSSVCNLVCSQSRSGYVEQVATIKSHAFHVGIFDTGESPATDRQRLNTLVSVDSQFLAIDNVHEERWQKLIFNASWNSMTAIADMNTYELFSKPSLVEIVRRLATEAFQIGLASGANLPEELPDRIIETAQKSGPIVTSTLHDARNGRTLEVYPITGKQLVYQQHADSMSDSRAGYLMAQANKLGISTPCLCMIYDQLQQLNEAILAQRRQPFTANRL